MGDRSGDGGGGGVVWVERVTSFGGVRGTQCCLRRAPALRATTVKRLPVIAATIAGYPGRTDKLFILLPLPPSLQADFGAHVMSNTRL